MLGTDDQKISRIENAKAYWERMNERLEWCRNAAKEYVKNNERRKFYKLTYELFGSDYHTIHAGISDADRKVVEDALKEEFEINGPFENEGIKKEFYDEVITEILYDYIPEKDRRWDNVHPHITDIDFNDFIYCTHFKCKCSVWYGKDPEELYDFGGFIELSNNEFINLVAARLYDKELSFYDLKYLFEDIYNRVDSWFYSRHQHHVIFLSEINDVAQAILDSKSEDDMPKLRYTGYLSTIEENPDVFNDKILLKLIKFTN